MGMSDFPCWLSARDAAIASSFIAYDEEFGAGYRLASVLGWRLASAHGEVLGGFTRCQF